MVVGTGDLSELALGWATYNSDHMSMYSVNGSIRKRWCATLLPTADRTLGELSDVLQDVLDTRYRPSCCRLRTVRSAKDRGSGRVGSRLFPVLHAAFRLSAAQDLRAAHKTFEGVYDDATIKWLTTFMRRFFTQQFNAPACRMARGRHRNAFAARHGVCRRTQCPLWLKEAESL